MGLRFVACFLAAAASCQIALLPDGVFRRVENSSPPGGLAETIRYLPNLRNAPYFVPGGRARDNRAMRDLRGVHREVAVAGVPGVVRRGNPAHHGGDSAPGGGHRPREDREVSQQPREDAEGLEEGAEGAGQEQEDDGTVVW